MSGLWIYDQPQKRTEVLLGPSHERRLGTYVVPPEPARPDVQIPKPRAELLGTLDKFIAYLAKMGVSTRADWDDKLDWHHVFHKYAYIAKGLGMRLEYHFSLLEVGAFSADMEADLYDLEQYETCPKKGGIEPFAGNPYASAAFVELVYEKGMEWLQIATFAVREFNNGQTCEEFVETSRGRTKYDRHISKDAYERVNAQMKKLSVGIP